MTASELEATENRAIRGASTDAGDPNCGSTFFAPLIPVLQERQRAAAGPHVVDIVAVEEVVDVERAFEFVRRRT